MRVMAAMSATPAGRMITVCIKKRKCQKKTRREISQKQNAPAVCGGTNMPEAKRPGGAPGPNIPEAKRPGEPPGRCIRCDVLQVSGDRRTGAAASGRG